MKLKYILPVAIIAMVLFITSCKKKDNPLPLPVPVLNPTITSFAPLHAKGGDTIIITGTDFSTTLASNIVKVNGKAATVIAATATSLSIKVPSLSGSGNLSVAIDTKSATSAAKFGYDTVWNLSDMVGTGVQGQTDGNFANAEFIYPNSITIDSYGKLYVSSYISSTEKCIRIIDTLNKQVTTWKDPAGTPYAFQDIQGLAFSNNNILYVSSNANRIFSLSASGFTFFVGNGGSGFQDGFGSNAFFYNQRGITVDKNGDLFVADFSNYSIRKVTKEGYVSTVVGTPTDYSFPTKPYATTIDEKGTLYASDDFSKIYKIDTVTKQVSLLAGTDVRGNKDGTSATAQFSKPAGIAVDINGNVYVADTENKSIRKIDKSGNVTTIVTNVAVNNLTINKNGVLYLADYDANKIKTVTPQ